MRVRLLILAVVMGAFAAPRASIFANTGEAEPQCLLNLRDWTPEDLDTLVDSLAYVMGGGNLKILAPERIEDLMKVGLLSRAEDLKDPESWKAILRGVRSQVTYEEFKRLFPTGMRDSYSQGPDHLDHNRSWGWRILPDDDVAFKDPNYLRQLLFLSGASSSAGMPSGRFNRFEWYNDFQNEWGLLHQHKTRPIAIAQTGSDANNLLYDIAALSIEAKGLMPAADAEILVFSGNYGAGRGKMRRFSERMANPAEKEAAREWTLENPWDIDPENLEGVALESLILKENAALEKIRKKATEDPSRIGGVAIESFHSTYTAIFRYRKSFMLRLRELCTKLKVPIFVDEIMTGAGRTGRLFGYEHYEGFVPDYITFGKGFLVSGVAQVQESPVRFYGAASRLDFISSLTNFAGAPESLLKSIQVMKRIRTGGLIQKAQEIGQYALARTNAAGHDRSSGLGVFLVLNGRRVLPPLTWTREQVNEFIPDRH